MQLHCFRVGGYLWQRSVWPASSCHYVEQNWITEISSLEFWLSTLIRSGRITEELFSTQESKQWNMHLCSLDTSRSASTLCNRRIIKKAPYLLLFPHQWFTHSWWRTHNKPAVRIHTEEVVWALGYVVSASRPKNVRGLRRIFFSLFFFQLPVLLLHPPVLEVNMCFLSGKQSQCQDLVSHNVSTHHLPSPDSGGGMNIS